MWALRAAAVGVGGLLSATVSQAEGVTTVRALGLKSIAVLG